jgi:hypothetical protein
MKVILSTSPDVVMEQVNNGIATLKSDCILNLIANKHGGEIKYIGRDNLKRAQVSLSFPLFEAMKADKEFILFAEKIRRFRITKENASVLELILYSNICEIDNDLDS